MSNSFEPAVSAASYFTHLRVFLVTRVVLTAAWLMCSTLYSGRTECRATKWLRSILASNLKSSCHPNTSYPAGLSTKAMIKAHTYWQMHIPSMSQAAYNTCGPFLEISIRQLQHLGGLPILCISDRGHTLFPASHSSKLRLLSCLQVLGAGQSLESCLSSNKIQVKFFYYQLLMLHEK